MKKVFLVEIIKSSFLLAMSISCLFFLNSIDKQAKKEALGRDGQGSGAIPEYEKMP